MSDAHPARPQPPTGPEGTPGRQTGVPAGWAAQPPATPGAEPGTERPADEALLPEVPEVPEAPDRADAPVPGSARLLTGLVVAHAGAAAATLAGSGWTGPAGGVAAGDVALAIAVTLLAVRSLRRAPAESVVATVLVGCALVGGVRAAALADPLLALTVLPALLATLAVRSGRAVAAVLVVCAGSVAGGIGTAVARGGTLTAALLAAAVVVAIGIAAVGLRSVLRRALDAAESARAAVDLLRVTDGLTGVLNRRGLDLLAAQMIDLARRRGEAVHAVYVDVDGFSEVNAEVGYDRADGVLVAVAEALRGAVRQTDVVGRVGGDEFVVLGPGTGTSPLELERRMREILRGTPPVPEPVWPSAVSLGTATLVPWDDGDLGSLLARADADMRLRRSLRRQNAERRGAPGPFPGSAPGPAATGV